MQLEITRIETLGEHIKAFELRDGSGSHLPPFHPGAHLSIHLQAGLSRQYSLISDPEDLSHYAIAVLYRRGGRASTFFHHRVGIGAEFDVDPPINGFPLVAAAHTILIAGGIGITPIYSHARELARRGNRFELHYAAHSRSRLALTRELDALCTDEPHYYVSEERRRLDVSKVLASPRPDVAIYVCGPANLIEEVRSVALQKGWKPEQVHLESFGARWKSTDEAIDLRLSLSSLDLHVPVGKTILEAMEEAGVWVPYECRRGECHTCMTQVVEGEPLHRDHCLSIQERGVAMTPCVSWARGGRLVLEL